MVYYSGWWYTYPSEIYEFVSWDDSSQSMEEHIPNHQPENHDKISAFPHAHPRESRLSAMFISIFASTNQYCFTHLHSNRPSVGHLGALPVQGKTLREDRFLHHLRGHSDMV